MVEPLAPVIDFLVPSLVKSYPPYKGIVSKSRTHQTSDRGTQSGFRSSRQTAPPKLVSSLMHENDLDSQFEPNTVGTTL